MRNTIVITAVVVLLGAGCGRTVTPPPAPPQSLEDSGPRFARDGERQTAPQPPISISEPAAGTMVGSPLTARGLGIAFENTIQIRVVDANGVVLADTHATALAPDYAAPGPWEVTFALGIPATANTGFIEAFESSAKDGRELNHVRIPIQFASPVSLPPPTLPTATLRTNYGYITLELFAKEAPKTVENFLRLAREGFYNGTQFHRVIPDFMIQGGDPLTREQPENRAVHGTGGPGYTFSDEFNMHKVVRGALAMANAGPNTNGSQFFIVTADTAPWLDGKHTVFGHITSGMEIVERIAQVEREQRDHPVDGVIIEEMLIVYPEI